MATTTKTAGTRTTGPNLPVDDRSGDGYDYMETAEAAGWATIALWGKDGYDFGAWPYVIGFVRSADNGQGGRRFGFGLYTEGDTKTTYYDTREQVVEAISREAHWAWVNGQSSGPANLPEKFEDLAEEYRQPFN